MMASLRQTLDTHLMVRLRKEKSKTIKPWHTDGSAPIDYSINGLEGRKTCRVRRIIFVASVGDEDKCLPSNLNRIRLFTSFIGDFT
jgi:hypothetical protein